MLSSNNSNHLSFRANLIRYLILKASTPTLIKLSQCNKRIKNLVKCIHGSFCDRLSIVQFDSIPYHPISMAKNGYISAEFRMNDKNLNADNPLQVRDQLNLYLSVNEEVNEVISKIDVQKLKKININNGFLSGQVFMNLLNPSLIKIDLRRTMVQDCDTLAYIIENCQQVKELLLPFQPDITNFANYSAIESKIKLKHFILTDIEYVPPQEVAEFVRKYMIENGELWFWFNLRIPNNYFKEAQALLPKNFRFNAS